MTKGVNFDLYARQDYEKGWEVLPLFWQDRKVNFPKIGNAKMLQQLAKKIYYMANGVQHSMVSVVNSSLLISIFNFSLI